MEQSLITGFLAVSVALMNPSSVTLVNTTSEKAQQMWDYRVLEGDTMLSIAERAYGSGDYWTTIWNDNSYIENPDIIEKGMILKIRIIKPTAPDVLKDELLNPAGQANVAVNTIPNQVTEAKTNPETITETAPQASTQTTSNGPLNEAQINFLGNCEAGMNPTRNSGNGYYGAFQFSYGTWQSMGTGYERADLAPIEVQIAAVQRLVARSSIFHQFPACARRMQAMGII
jgi:hypothetical protein